MSTVEPRTRAEFVADELRQMIASGALAPGAKLRQLEVAERFSVSTTPVREAFTALAREGLVRQDAHRGVHVFRPTIAEIRENYEIRLALEPLATEIAARVIDDDALAEVESLLDRFERVPQLRLGTELNRDFHLTIYRAAQRPALLALIERLRHSADAYVQLLVSQATADYREAVDREHREIAEALRRHSPRRAQRAMSAHLRHNFTEISRLLGED